MGENIVERVARIIADQVGDGFDNAHRNKPHWVETRGESGGRFRDVNEPRQNDYLDAARAAIAALREPSDAMIEAGEMCDAADVWRSMIDAILNEGNE